MRRRAALLSAALLLLPFLALPAWASDRVALVIGNAAYAHAPRLANPLNDADDIGSALERLGFAVTRLANADQSGMRRALQDFAKAASASEIAVVFYAGHGIEVDKRNFLVPVDARLLSDADVEFETVPLELVSRAVERARGLRLVILDACRENPFAASMQRAGATRSIGRGLARIEPSGETLVAYAAKEGTVAADGKGRNSPYSTALLDHLEEPGLEVGLMFRKVRDAVLAATGGAQEPFVYGSLSSKGAYVGDAPQTAHASPVAQAPAVPAATAPLRIAADHERLFWNSVKDSADPADLHAYLARYPDGVYVALANNRLKRVGTATPKREALATTAAAPPGKASAAARLEAERLAAKRLAEERELAFWTSVRDSRDAAELQAYLDRYPDGAYAVLARSRLKRLEEAAKPLADSGPGVSENETGPADQSAQAPAKVSPPSAHLQPMSEKAEAVLGLTRTDRRAIQAGLASLGFDPGPADGLFGRKTRAALMAWQSAKGEEATGWLTAAEAGALKAAGAEALRAKAKAEREAREARARAEAERKARAEAERKERARLAMQPGRVFRDCEECPEMVVVPAGSFVMGSPASEEGRHDDEGPQRRVTISKPFAVGKYEVTFGDWDACVAAGGCNRHRPDDGGWGRGWRPVMNVTWDQAKAYVGWLSRKTGESYRLLSEAEWEYAARAGTRTRYHWGDSVGRNRANCRGCGSRWDGNGTAPVGSFSANAFGLYDMHGNVWEWVEDCWHDSFAGAPSNGSAWVTGGSCSLRVFRGGSWFSDPRNLRSAVRGRSGSGNRVDVGFRIARTLVP